MWSEITTEEFEAVPGKEAPKPNRWDELLDVVDQGKVIRLPADDQNTLRGMRIGIGRRAKSRQIPIETRATENALLIRRAVDPPGSSSSPALAETRESDELSGAVVAEGVDEVEETEQPATASPRRGRRKS
jgi:hypothetical protein